MNQSYNQLIILYGILRQYFLCEALTEASGFIADLFFYLNEWYCTSIWTKTFNFLLHFGNDAKHYVWINGNVYNMKY